MGDFFKGWRRNIGVITLVMACVFAGGWVRSFGVHDFGCFGIGNRGHMIDSLDGSITWRAYDPDGRVTPHAWSESFQPNTKMTLGRLSPSYRPIHITISYWLVVVPSTLLSAYLLVGKPRPSNPKETTEPISVDGA